MLTKVLCWIGYRQPVWKEWVAWLTVLVIVGFFDLDTGVFDSLVSPNFVCDALEFSSDSRVSDLPY